MQKGNSGIRSTLKRLISLEHFTADKVSYVNYVKGARNLCLSPNEELRLEAAPTNKMDPRFFLACATNVP